MPGNTRKSVSPKRASTRKNHTLPENAATFHGLHHWHKEEFEKLGWMVLAKAKGMDYKIVAYKRAINHLITSIKHVMGEYEEHDRKHDLNVLLMQAECLKSFVDEHM